MVDVVAMLITILKVASDLTAIHEWLVFLSLVLLGI